MMKKLAAALLAVTAGCASDPGSAGFQISGRVDAPDVTHVVATDAETGKRIVVETGVGGRFELALESSRQWIVVFANWSKTGKAMQVATLRANELDAFVPQGPGAVDLGTLVVEGGRAYAAIGFDELLAALGLDLETATRMGRTDDLALRYANPDIDNDGTIDGLQHGHDYSLAVTGSFELTTQGRDATVDDLVAGTFANPGIRYAGTTLQATLPRAMGMNMATGTVTFEAPFYSTALGPDGPMIAPHTEIGAPHVKTGALDGISMIGVVARGDQDAPRGTYELGFSNGQLTFSDVHVPSASALSTARDFAVPFARITPATAGCKTDCDLGSIDLEWRRLTREGWVAAEPQQARIDLVARMNGKSTALAAELTDTSVDWVDMPIWNAGITRSELAYITTSEICFFQVSYQTELGMKMTTSVANPGCR